MSLRKSDFDSVLHPALSNQPMRLVIHLKVRLLACDPSVLYISGSLVHHEHLARNMKEARTSDVFECRRVSVAVL